MNKEEERKKVEATIDKLHKLIEKTGVKNIDMDAIRDAAYKRRHAKLDKMREVITEAKKLGADRAILKSMIAEDVIVDGGELGLGKVEYAWNKFVSMYFRYANPRDQVNPDPIRGKLTGVFKGIGDLCAWLGTTQMKYSGFWQGVVKNWANTFIAVINGAYAKIWIPETSPLTFQDSDGTVWIIPEVTKEYTTAQEGEGAPTRDIVRAYAFKHVCYDRQKKQWVNPAPYPHNEDFMEDRACVFYDCDLLTSTFVNHCPPWPSADTDDFYWEKYIGENTITEGINNYSFCSPEDFMWDHFTWTDDWGITSDNYNRLSHTNVNIYSDAIADENADNDYKAIILPYNEVVTFGLDHMRGWCEYQNMFQVFSMAKVGWPPVQPRLQIIGKCEAWVRPYMNYDDEGLGTTWDGCWWMAVDNNDGGWNMAGINPTLKSSNSGNDQHDNPIKWNQWESKLTSDPLPEGSIGMFRFMSNMVDGTDIWNISQGSRHIGLSREGSAQGITSLIYYEVRSTVNPGAFLDHNSGYKAMTFYIMEERFGNYGFSLPESHKIVKIGTVFAEYTVPVQSTGKSDRYWMIGYSYTVGGETRYKYFNEHDQSEGQEWWWTQMSGPTTITATIDVPEGTEYTDIVFCCNQSVGCEREQELYQKIEMVSSKVARVTWKVRSRHNITDIHSRRFTYYVIWPVDRVNPNPGPFNMGLWHPTSDNTYDPLPDDKVKVGTGYVAKTSYEDDIKR